MAKRTEFERDFADLHGMQPGDVFQDDIEVYEARRARRTAGPVYEVRTRNCRDRIALWWRGAKPVERFTRVWWLAICGMLGLALGACVIVALGPSF